mgnify:CR=1 FL=1
MDAWDNGGDSSMPGREKEKERLNLQIMPLFIIDIFPVMLIMRVFNSSDYDDYDVCAQRLQTKPCVHQDHQKGKVTPTRD